MNLCFPFTLNRQVKQCKNGPSCYYFQKGLCTYYHPYFHYYLKPYINDTIKYKDGQAWIQQYFFFNDEEKQQVFSLQFQHLIVKKKTNKNKYYNCRICLENYEYDDKVTITNCSHNFHSECLGKWIKTKGSCPLCQKNFLGQENGKNTAIKPFIHNSG